MQREGDDVKPDMMQNQYQLRFYSSIWLASYKPIPILWLFLIGRVISASFDKANEKPKQN